MNTNDKSIRYAEVGEFDGLVAFIVSRDEVGSIPHLHIGDAETYPACRQFHCTLKLQRPEYCNHNEDKCSGYLTRQQIDSLVEFINGIDEDGVSIWRYVLKTWNKNNHEVKVSMNTEIPDYSVMG